MTPTTGGLAPLPTAAVPHYASHGIGSWSVHLAAVGDAYATLGERSVVRIGEGPAGRRDAPDLTHATTPEQSDGPWTRLLPDPGGTLAVRGHRAPPVLLVRSPRDPAELLLGATLAAPLTGSAGLPAAASTAVRIGDLALALSPSLLETMEPQRVIAAPRLLWLAADPAALMVRWLQDAIRTRVAGAAVAVLRYRPAPSRPLQDVGRLTMGGPVTAPVPTHAGRGARE